jgi:DNA-binding response OmpR family regulator
LVLIDEILPGLSGTELAAIAADENTPGLLISAHPHVIGQLERYGFPYLAKPFSLEQLLAQSEAIVAAPEESILRVRNAIARMNASVDRRDPPDANGL